MKIRIKGNSLRFRLTRPEVEYFGKEGYIEENIEFGNSSLVYAVKKVDDGKLSAGFENNRITMIIPEQLADEWVNTNKVGCESSINTQSGNNLYLLLEKDFKCLDETIEDQSDNYENPLTAKK